MGIFFPWPNGDNDKDSNGGAGYFPPRKVESEVECEVESEVESEIESEVESEFESEVDSEVKSKIKSNVESEVESEAESRVWGGSGEAESDPEKFSRGKNLAGRSPARFFPRPSVEQVRRSNRIKKIP